MHPPHEWFALLALVLVMGVKHGLDADHLATIDGLTRHNLRHTPARAKWCGTLFSLGHGAVVILISLGAGLISAKWHVPEWMADVGTWISICFLTLLAGLNLRAVLIAPASGVVSPVGIKAGAMRRLQQTSNPLSIMAIGALFALSFDTLSQAALFAVTATQYGGIPHVLILGLTFTFGMLLADGANGLWIAHLLRRADRHACIASRVMGLMIAAISFAVAALTFLRWLYPDAAPWYEGREPLVGIGIIVLLTASIFLGSWLARGSRLTETA